MEADRSAALLFVLVVASVGYCWVFRCSRSQTGEAERKLILVSGTN